MTEEDRGRVLGRHVLAVLTLPWERRAVTVCLRSGRVAVLGLQERRRRIARGWRYEIVADLAELQEMERGRGSADLETWAAGISHDLTARAEHALDGRARRTA